MIYMSVSLFDGDDYDNHDDATDDADADKLKKTRFKIVVQTTIGQMRDQGIRIASRCLWDPTTDNYASCSYTNVRRRRRRTK